MLLAVRGLAAPLLLNGTAASGDGGQQMHSGLCLWRQILPYKSIHHLPALHFGLWKVPFTRFPQASVSYIASNNALSAEHSAFKTLGRQKTTRHISVLPIQHQGLLPQNTWHHCQHSVNYRIHKTGGNNASSSLRECDPEGQNKTMVEMRCSVTLTCACLFTISLMFFFLLLGKCANSI